MTSSDIHYDPTDWQTQIDPYPIYKRLRDEAPIYHNEEMEFWAVSRFEDCWDAHLDWETFSSAWGPTLEKIESPLPIMIAMDPPTHTRLRQLISKVFTPRRVSELEPIVREITRTRLAGLEPGDQIDLFEQLASSMPMDVISTMMGVPEADRDRVRHLTNAAMHRESGLEVPESAMQAQGEVVGYWAEFVKDRMANPGGDDLMAAMIGSEVQRDDGEKTRLTFEELMGFCILLGNAGHETTSRLICNSAVTLARNPDQRSLLLDAPQKTWENAVEEMLRIDPPSQVQGRWTTRPWTRHGVTIPEDVRVLMLTGAAHRDERQFEDPDRFDVNRKLDRTLHFGQGHHLCLGKSLARQECRVAFEEILARFPDYEVDEANLEWAHNNNVRGYAKVPMRL